MHSSTAVTFQIFFFRVAKKRSPTTESRVVLRMFWNVWYSIPAFEKKCLRRSQRYVQQKVSRQLCCEVCDSRPTGAACCVRDARAAFVEATQNIVGTLVGL